MPNNASQHVWVVALLCSVAGCAHWVEGQRLDTGSKTKVAVQGKFWDAQQVSIPEAIEERQTQMSEILAQREAIEQKPPHRRSGVIAASPPIDAPEAQDADSVEQFAFFGLLADSYSLSLSEPASHDEPLPYSEPQSDNPSPPAGGPIQAQQAIYTAPISTAPISEPPLPVAAATPPAQAPPTTANPTAASPAAVDSVPNSVSGSATSPATPHSATSRPAPSDPVASISVRGIVTDRGGRPIAMLHNSDGTTHVAREGERLILEREGQPAVYEIETIANGRVLVRHGQERMVIR